jgi:hypothetical protein
MPGPVTEVRSDGPHRLSPGPRRVQVVGAKKGAPGAEELAEKAAALLERYVHEVVLAFRLCPFLHNPEGALGAVVVVLDDPPVEETLADTIETLGAPIVHALYPLVSGDSPPFERFASRAGQVLRARLGRAAPVSAAFHPKMHGETDDPHRLIGLLRRAPHPFVQYVPADVPHGGGTVVAGAPLPPKSGAEANFARLTGVGSEVDRILAILDELHRARDAELTELTRRVAGHPG